MSNVSFHKLLKLAQDRNLDGKGGLAATVAKMCLQEDSSLNEGELKLAFEILRELVDEVEMEIRRYIADYLAFRNDVPKELLEFLANDSIHVAYPILVNSVQLTDSFLIDLISRKQRGHHMAIAERNILSSAISHALIETKDDLVAGKLLENPGAEIDDDDMDMLVERAVDHPKLQYKLLSRGDLPNHVAQRMYVWVGEAARQYILNNYNIPDDLANMAVYDSVSKAKEGFSDSSELEENDKIDLSNSEAYQLSNALYQSLVVDGKQAFILDYAYKMGLTIAVTEMIFDLSQVNTIAIACKAIGFSEDQFRELLKKFLQEKFYSYNDNSLIEKAVGYFKKVNQTKADAFMENWRASSSQITKTFD